MKKCLSATLAVLTAGSPTVLAKAAEWTPNYLGCEFTVSAFSETDDIYPDHRFETQLKVGPTKFELAFAAIDLAAQHAQLIGNQGSAQILAVRGGFESLVFLERTPGGSVNLTTVFAPTSTGMIRAVSSRHIAQPLGGYMASQYLGTCKEHFGDAPVAGQ